MVSQKVGICERISTRQPKVSTIEIWRYMSEYMSEKKKGPGGREVNIFIPKKCLTGD